VKIILEFNDDEIKQAEQAYHGPEYAMAVEDFRNFLRNTFKHREMSDEARKMAEEINDEFFQIFGELIRD
jgi:hypothetical protein